MDNEKVSEFYDEYSERQIKIGANERLISLYKRMLKSGLKSQSNVLELGCGVGIFTKLLAKKVKSGKIEAVDLSPKSVEIAQKNLKKENVVFKTADVVNYLPEIKNIDFITLLDVIEHIPLENHAELFANISKNCSEKTLVVINFPNPRYIEFLQKNNADGLQIIDQPVEFKDLVNRLENNNLEIIFYEKYGIWEVEDYDFMLIRKKRNFELRHLSDSRSFSEKISNKISKTKDKIWYK